VRFMSDSKLIKYALKVLFLIDLESPVLPVTSDSYSEDLIYLP
jgi:hypothetical protein